MNEARGMVYLVGAGPGDPGLLTVHGLRLLQEADVVLHDRLIGRDLLTLARIDAEIIDVGKTNGDAGSGQDEIHNLMIDRAQRGLRVVRLKGGDPFVFGRGYEEMLACRQAGVPCVVVPGVSSALAAPAAVGIPVTLRGRVRALAVVTGSTADEDATPNLDYSALARIDTVVVLMGRASLASLTRSLIQAGRAPATPVACIERATTPHQRVTTGTLADIAEAVDRDGLKAPVVTVIGDVAAEADVEASYLLSAAAIGSDVVHEVSAEQTAFRGRRIVLTRPVARTDEFRRRLEAAGATVITCPMIRIVYPARTDAVDARLAELEDYSWLVFTSAHGVKGFWRRLTALGGDARTLASCRVAAIGPATTNELRRRGIVVDVEPRVHTADGLAEALARRWRDDLGGKVLYLKGNLAGPSLTQKLTELGATVDDLIVYETHDASPTPAAQKALAAGVDAVTFFSPSAVRRFAALGLSPVSGIVACIGPSTAAAARSAGLTVDIVADEPGVSGLLAAMTRHFVASESPA